MSEELFSNKAILEWLQYYVDNTKFELDKVKLLDISKKNKNLIPTVESNECVMVFTEAGHPDIFYRMWDVGLGECDVWYNDGSEPSGPIRHDKVKDMIDRGINASAAMMVVNPNARSTYKIGMATENFSKGSVQYVGSEIRAIILNKMHLSYGDDVCCINSESIAVETAIAVGEGNVIAVEYSRNDRKTMEDNVEIFGLNNVTIVDHVDKETFDDLPTPAVVMLVASASMEQEIAYFLDRNPDTQFVVYTLDFKCAATISEMFSDFGIDNVEVIQIEVSKLHQNNFRSEPAPWIISACGAEK